VTLFDIEYLLKINVFHNLDKIVEREKVFYTIFFLINNYLACFSLLIYLVFIWNLPQTSIHELIADHVITM